jgi:CRISPR-associated exonuclease Cas4
MHFLAYLPAGILFLALVALLSLLSLRARLGFSFGHVVSYDRLTLSSEHYGLVGRPDLIVKRGRSFIPEEKKRGTRLHESYVAQMGVYLLLVEEHFQCRPPYGVVVLGNGRRENITNSEQLRASVLTMVETMRSARTQPRSPLPARPHPAKCRGCGQRNNCTQRLL